MLSRLKDTITRESSKITSGSEIEQEIKSVVITSTDGKAVDIEGDAVKTMLKIMDGKKSPEDLPQSDRDIMLKV